MRVTGCRAPEEEAMLVILRTNVIPRQILIRRVRHRPQEKRMLAVEENLTSWERNKGQQGSEKAMGGDRAEWDSEKHRGQKIDLSEVGSSWGGIRNGEKNG